MSKKLPVLLSAMLVFSLVSPTALAETDTSEGTTPSEPSVILSTDSESATKALPVVDAESEEVVEEPVVTEEHTESTPVEQPVKPTEEQPTTTSTEEKPKVTTEEKAVPSEEKPQEKPEKVDEKPADVKETKPKVSLDGLPTSSKGGAPESISDLEQKFYEGVDVTVDKATSPYKDGIYLELRYVNPGHIPTFKVALVDAEGKGLGSVEANRANYDTDLQAYKLVIPHSKAIKYGDNIGIYAYDFDGSVKNITLKRSLPLAEEGEGEDSTLKMVEETVPMKKENYFFYKMGYFLVEHDEQIEKHYTFSAFNPLEGWVETNSNLIAFTFKTDNGTPVKNTTFALKGVRGKDKVTVKTDAYGVAYVERSKLKEKLLTIDSDQYELSNRQANIAIDPSAKSDRTLTKTIVVQQKVKDVQNEGVANVTITSKGDTTLTSEWVDTTLTFTSGTNTLKFDIGKNDIKNGLKIKLPNGKYKVTSTSQNSITTLSQDTITVKDNDVNLSLTIAPKYLLEVSKDGKPFDFKVLNVQDLTGKVISGKNTISYGVVPNQSFMIEDQADGKVYTVFINPDYTVTKLVLGVGTVWGGEVSTPHTGDNIIFLVSLFLLCLIIAGVGFYFHKTGKRVKNLAVTTGLIGLLIVSSMPVNFAKASYVVSIDGSAAGSGATGSYGQMPAGTFQVHANQSLLMTNFVPMPSMFELVYIYGDGKELQQYDLDKYILDQHHLATSLFFPTNAEQQEKAMNGSFMVYDYEKGGLRPFWGNKNAVLGDVSEKHLSSNRTQYGILNSNFSDRLMTYPEKGWQNNGANYKNDIDSLINHITTALGGGGDSRQLWTGKDINGAKSSSTSQIGDVIVKEQLQGYIKRRYKEYFPDFDIEQGLPVDVGIEMYLGALEGKTSNKIISDLREATVAEFTYESIGDDFLAKETVENSEPIIETIGGKSANYMLTFQNVHGVYINGGSQTHMAYMPVADIGEWFHDTMRKASSNYRALNILPTETAKMLYHPKVTHGTSHPTYSKVAPTQTFHGNLEGTTGKSLMPKTLKLQPRANNSVAELDKNPYAGWGYLYMSSFMHNYACASCTSVGPGVYSWLELNITNEDGSEEKKKIPWNKAITEKGEPSNFLDFLKYEKNKTYYDFDGAYVHDGVRYELNDNEGNTEAKVTLKDRTDKLSLLRPYGGSLDTGGKYEDLYDGFYFLHKDEKRLAENKVDATNLPLILDNEYLPFLSSVKAYLSGDPEFKSKTTKAIADAEGAGEDSFKVNPIPNSGYKYPTKAYGDTGFILGEHYSQADLTLELWVDATCLDQAKCGDPIEPEDASASHIVPEWRFSEYYDDATKGKRSDSLVNFKTPGSTWWNPAVTNSGNTKFNLSTSDLSAVPWLESKPKMFNGDTEYRNVSAYGNSFRFQVGGDLLAIKDNSTVTNSKLASWKNDYSILNKKVAATVKGAVEPNGKNSITKKHTVQYLVRSPYSSYTYSEDRIKCGAFSCWVYRWSGAANMSYDFDSTNHITVVFKRYNPKEGVNAEEFAKKSDKETNGFYWESYQDTQALKVNPEVAMVYDDNTGNVTVVQSAADRIREIKPVHYNSIRFKDVTIEPKVDGMSVATDAEAKRLANSKGASKVDVIYKGASTSVSYEVKGELELRTYALDIGSTALKNTWGNSGYSTEKVRDEFLTRHATKEADGTWTIKPTAKGNYVINNKDYGGVSEIKNVKQKGYKVLEHTLVVRGGELLSVNGQKDLSAIDPQLKDAVERMQISTERGKNVFKQFEFNKGANLNESDVADLINKTRGVDELKVGSPWYYEDATTLVIREYITTYDLPPHVYVDKIPQEVAGIPTPMDKAQFFKQGHTGHTKLRFQLVDTWMEYDTSKAPYTAPYSSQPYGPQQTLYVVPNVSVTDTAQF